MLNYSFLLNHMTVYIKFYTLSLLREHNHTKGRQCCIIQCFKLSFQLLKKLSNPDLIQTCLLIQKNLKTIFYSTLGFSQFCFTTFVSSSPLTLICNSSTLIRISLHGDRAVSLSVLTSKMLL